MHRRQFLQILNAMGASFVLPASAFYDEGPSVTTSTTTQPLVELENTAELADSGWDIPKVGIVSVGGIGGTCLPRLGYLTQSLPYLNRTIAIDTSGIELSLMEADRKVLVGDGKTLLNAHAAGLLAPSTSHEIADAVAGLDMVLLVVGMGGNTGTRIAPIVAQVLRNQGILTLGFVVMPSNCEGQPRQQIAQAGIRKLRPHVNALIPFFNNDIAPEAKQVRWLSAAAQQAPQAFIQLCRNIMDPFCGPSLVNIDFEDLRHIILSQEGDCAFGFGSASGMDGAAAAALHAIDHPLLGQSRLQRASAALVAIAAPPKTLTLRDSRNAMNSVRNLLPKDAYIIYGASYDASLENEIVVSVLANGIQEA